MIISMLANIGPTWITPSHPRFVSFTHRCLDLCDSFGFILSSQRLLCSRLVPSFSSGTDGAHQRHQRLPVWLGRCPPPTGPGTEEEGDGLVQEVPGPAGHQTRRGATATEKIRPHGCVRQRFK